ncbi:MAG: hypothetical protein WC519_00605 [Parcubacteria group bacterium]
MVALGAVPLVVLQFSFSNPNVIPVTVKRQNRETFEEHVARKGRSTSGVMVIEPTERCSLVEFLKGLETAGYEMVDAFYKERIDDKDSRNKRTYHMVRFLFARREFIELSGEFKMVRDVVLTELRHICEGAMWRVRAFSNPFYKNGEEIPDQRTLSVNLEVRQPLFYPDGEPVTVWQKDGNGKRVGDTSLPLKADYCLRIVGDVVQLETA